MPVFHTKGQQSLIIQSKYTLKILKQFFFFLKYTFLLFQPFSHKVCLKIAQGYKINVQWRGATRRVFHVGFSNFAIFSESRPFRI